MIAFRKLTIERHLWGDDKDKLSAELVVEGNTANVTVKLADEAATKILMMCAGIVGEVAAQHAEAFRKEFVAAVATMKEAK